MASPWQTVRELRRLVTTATWDDGSNGLVIGSSAYIRARVDQDDGFPDRLPFALLNVGNGTPDPDLPGLVSQEFIIVIATRVEGDSHGEAMLIGRKPSTTGKTGGQGVLPLVVPILASVKYLNGADGLPAKVAHVSTPINEQMDDGRIAWQQIILRAMCTTENHYPAPCDLVATGGSGQIALTWTRTPARFDRQNTIVRYASGSTPPASATTGTGWTLSDAANDTSTTITGLRAGTYSVAIFGGYADFGTTVHRYSDQVAGTTRASVSVT